MRSRSEATRIATMISRRSSAMGWRLAMVRIAFSSMASSSASILSSVAMMRSAASISRLDERVDRLAQLVLGEAAHLGEHGLERRQFLVVGFLTDMFGHAMVLLAVSRSGR